MHKVLQCAVISDDNNRYLDHFQLKATKILNLVSVIDLHLFHLCEPTLTWSSFEEGTEAYACEG